MTPAISSLIYSWKLEVLVTLGHITSKHIFIVRSCKQFSQNYFSKDNKLHKSSFLSGVSSYKLLIAPNVLHYEITTCLEENSEK